jgi:hypothetical protein
LLVPTATSLEDIGRKKSLVVWNCDKVLGCSQEIDLNGASVESLGLGELVPAILD